VERAASAGLLDDRAFTKLWIDDRLLNKPLSRRAIREELLHLGIEATLVRELLDQQYPADREPLLALDLARQRLRRTTTDSARQMERVTAYLIRRGFDRGTALRAVRAAADSMEEETSDAA